MLRDLLSLEKITIVFNQDWATTIGTLSPVENQIFLQHAPLNELEGHPWNIVALTRDPRDVRVSMWHYLNSSSDPQMTMQHWSLPADSRTMDMTGFWLQKPDLWWRMYMEHFKRIRHYRLRFEDMRDDSLREVSLLLEWLNVDCAADSIRKVIQKRGFESFHNENPIHFRSGEIGQWHAFDHTSKRTFNRLYHSILREFGYLFGGGRSEPKKRAYGASI